MQSKMPEGGKLGGVGVRGRGGVGETEGRKGDRKRGRVGEKGRQVN